MKINDIVKMPSPYTDHITARIISFSGNLAIVEVVKNPSFMINTSGRTMSRAISSIVIPTDFLRGAKYTFDISCLEPVAPSAPAARKLPKMTSYSKNAYIKVKHCAGIAKVQVLKTFEYKNELFAVTQYSTKSHNDKTLIIMDSSECTITHLSTGYNVDYSGLTTISTHEKIRRSLLIIDEKYDLFKEKIKLCKKINDGVSFAKTFTMEGVNQ